METGNYEQFDLLLISKQDDIRLRPFIDNFTMPANEYFRLLSKFIQLAPGAMDAINKFAFYNYDRDAYTKIAAMSDLLEKMRCFKFNLSLSNILDSYDQGNWHYSAQIAKKASDDFNAFSRRVESAKGIADTVRLPGSDLPVYEYFRYLDAGEATGH